MSFSINYPYNSTDCQRMCFDIYVRKQPRDYPLIGGDKMKKIISTLIISIIFAFMVLGAITFVMRMQTAEEKESGRRIADSIALNCSGQGLSSPFIPEGETKDGTFKFWTYSNIKNDDKSCMLYVSIITENHKHLTVRYPCQVQDRIIYSVGLDFANEKTFSLIEYIIMGVSSFLICFTLINTVKVIKG